MRKKIFPIAVLTTDGLTVKLDEVDPIVALLVFCRFFLLSDIVQMNARAQMSAQRRTEAKYRS